MDMKKKPKHPFYDLMNVGPATFRDLEILGIQTIEDLAKADPQELFLRLQVLTGVKQDPCVWYVFAAIVHEAKTGEKTPWWAWTKVIKPSIKS
jgi:predicted RecB family nuclease